MSYPLYVSHWLTMDLVFHLSAKASFDLASHPALHLALLILASLAVAVLLSAAWDRPMQRLAKTLSP